MFDRAHHQRIAKILKAFNSDLLLQAECYLAGDTAVVLSLAEYRESTDVNFLCASNAGYRLLRNTVTDTCLGALLNEPVKLLREVHKNQYGFRTFLEVDGTPIKVEFLRENLIPISGCFDQILGVPILSKADMYAEKLLANADRGLDKFEKSRDLIDLTMMIDCWGEMPKEALGKVYKAYGGHVIDTFHKTLELIQDRIYLLSCLRSAHMDEGMADRIAEVLRAQLRIIGHAGSD